MVKTIKNHIIPCKKQQTKKKKPISKQKIQIYQNELFIKFIYNHQFQTLIFAQKHLFFIFQQIDKNTLQHKNCAFQQSTCNQNIPSNFKTPLTSTSKYFLDQAKIQQISKYAQKFKGLLINISADNLFKFKCNKGHCWQQHYEELNYNECCRICSKQEVQNIGFKNYIKDQEAKLNQKYSELQQNLYKQAQSKALNTKENEENTILDAAKKVEMQIEKLAEEEAELYLQNQANCEQKKTSFTSLKFMFKILLFPEKILQIYLNYTKPQIIKKQYKIIAKYIHPDKNFHPKASESFQKLNNFYNQVSQN